MTAASPDAELAETFSGIARVLLVAGDIDATLAKIVTLAVGTIDGCEHAGVTLVEGRRVRSPAPSDDTAVVMDRIQKEAGEGPCFDAIGEHAVFHVGSLSTETRWPRFAPRAHRATGVESIVSIHLFVERDTIGALNLFSREVDAFDDHAIAVATIFAAHASGAMLRARQQDDFARAIESRDLIGQAKGMLMAREGITAEQAFDVLRRASQRLNVKLRDIAEGMITGDQPPTK